MQHRQEQKQVDKKQHMEDCKIRQVSQLVTGLAGQGTGQETGQQLSADQLEDGEEQVPYKLWVRTQIGQYCTRQHSRR
jgi:hypothetical protein